MDNSSDIIIKLIKQCRFRVLWRGLRGTGIERRTVVFVPWVHVYVIKVFNHREIIKYATGL